MRVLIIGLGSMGKRRIRLIKQYSSLIEIVGIDSRSDRCREARELYNIEICERISTDADAAFICTSPVSHHEIITGCLNEGLHVFTEINLVPDNYVYNLRLAKNKNLILFLSSTFLYRQEISYIDKCIKELNSKVNYIYHTGQYLPDWHPWEELKEFFVSDKRSNGCREIFAIELPWIQMVFGQIENIVVKSDKNSKLDIGYDDNYLLIIEHKNGSKGMLAVDVITRKAVRKLEVYNEELYLTWDGTPTGLFRRDISAKEEIKIELYDKIDKIEGYSATIIENAYFNEIKQFFDIVAGTGESIYGFEQDLITLGWIDKIEGVESV